MWKSIGLEDSGVVLSGEAGGSGLDEGLKSPDDSVDVASPRPSLVPPDVSEEDFAHQSTAPVKKCGWIYKDSVRRTVLGIFPNAGRHFKNLKKRWFILYEDGKLCYFKMRDAVDPDDPWSLVGDGADEVRDSSLVEPPGDVRLSTVGSKMLELRGNLQVTSSCVCQGHFYSDEEHTLSVKFENGDEILIKCADQADFDSWLYSFNDVIAKLLAYSSAKKDRKGLTELAFYVKRRLSLEHSMRTSTSELASDDINDEDELDGYIEVDSANNIPSASNIVSSSSIPHPNLKIVILVVGTRGDVAPFVAMGKKLRGEGHTVRIATHSMYRNTVTSAGLLFYPLGGDPVMLSGFMVKTHGKLMPNLLDVDEIRDHTEDLPIKLQMLREICWSTWPACTAPDPEDPNQTPFVAEAIISNPVTYGHSHCAEALGVPLHMFFPQPWTPTKAFPHVFSSLPQSKGWSMDNYLSYFFVDQFLWMGTEGFVNDFREEVLELPMLRRGELGGHRLNTLRVPFCYMFSPSLVPKPKDWPTYTDVVGNFFAASKTSSFEDADLASFLDEDRENPPVFVGFGSMVIAEPEKLASTIAQAARRTNTRVLLQSSWSKLATSEDDNEDGGKKLIYCLGNCPHDWLFPQMAAVVHHGGAGTVAAGLRAGKPTLVCPFFGDQHFWGEVVSRAGVGPSPILSHDLNVDNLSDAFEQLKSTSMREKAEQMSQCFEREDGVKAGVEAFYRNLPTEDMVCDVSLFLPEAHKENPNTRFACRWCSECQMKMCLEVDAIIHAKGSSRSHHVRTKYAPVDWGTADGPSNALDGFAQGVFGMGQEVMSALTGVVVEPIKGAQKDGIKGSLKGVATGMKNLVLRPLRGGLIFVDKAGAGIATHVVKKKDQGGKSPFRRFAIYDKVFQIERRVIRALGKEQDFSEKSVSKKDQDDQAVFLSNMSDEMKADILHAYDVAKECHEVFVDSEKVRLGEGKDSVASQHMMRTLSLAITESRRGSGASTGANKGGDPGLDEALNSFFDSYFGVKGGRMQFAEFVSRFLFAGTEAAD